jgi:hypothetical protein
LDTDLQTVVQASHPYHSLHKFQTCRTLPIPYLPSIRPIRQLIPKTPSKFRDPAYKLRPEHEQIERFKDQFKKTFGPIDEKESKENVKDHLMDFLKEVYYRDTCVEAPKGKTDFVIHLGKEARLRVGNYELEGIRLPYAANIDY